MTSTESITGEDALSAAVADYLSERDLRYSVADGVYVVPYAPSTDPNQTPTLVVLVWTGAEAGDGVMVEMHARPLPAETDVAALLGRCNDWNIRCRESKARLHIGAADMTVVVEAWLPAPPDGVGRPMLREFLDRALREMVGTAQVEMEQAAD